LLNPDEIGRMLSRIDDRDRPGYPGLVLALIPGEHPLLARRVNYFQSRRFAGYFDPHPNHPPPLTLAELTVGPRLVIDHPPASSLWRGFFRDVGRAVAIVCVGSALIYGGYWAYQHRDAAFAGSPTRPDFRRMLSPPVSSGSTIIPPASPIAAYEQGAADWRAQHAWFAAQTGDRHAGAHWWATHRARPDVVPCNEAARDYSANGQAAALFEAGCNDAKRWLDPIDRKQADPQYKAGFNDEAKRNRL
jgi:hypothetical protein